MEQVAIMQNIFYGRKVSIRFDLKGTKRGRFAKLLSKEKKQSTTDDTLPEVTTGREINNHKISVDGKYDKKDLKKKQDDNLSISSGGTVSEASDKSNQINADHEDEGSINHSKAEQEKVGLDGDFLEYTGGAPLPMSDRAKALFHMSILNVS